MYSNQIIMLSTLNLCRVVCQSYLNKTSEKKKRKIYYLLLIFLKDEDTPHHTGTWGNIEMVKNRRQSLFDFSREMSRQIFGS